MVCRPRLRKDARKVDRVRAMVRSLFLSRIIFSENRYPLSVQPAENGGERNREDFLAELVGGVEHPAAPIFLAGRHDIGAHDAMGVLAGLDKIVDDDAAPGGELVFFV